MNTKLNINIDKEDHNLNDYLYCWHIFKERPNRLNIFDNFDSKSFTEFISNKEVKIESSFSDIARSQSGEFVINERRLLKYDDFIFISYVEVDKMSTLEESLITDVSIIYSSSIEISKINDLINELNNFSVVEESEEVEESKVSAVTFTPNGLDTLSISLIQADYDNIDFYYNDDTIKESDKLIKILKKKSKSLSLVFGDRGNGKTTLLNYISSKIKKNVIFIPLNLIESTINNPDFRNFITSHSNSILVIEDLDNYLLNSKSTYFTNNLLQLVDGFQSDDLKLHILCSVNVDNIDEIDENLLQCNNIGKIIEIKRLEADKVDELCKHLGQKNKFKSSQRVVDVLRNNKTKEPIAEIGFN